MFFEGLFILRKKYILPYLYPNRKILLRLMFNLILFGPPGSGKGTQSEKIIEKFHLVHLSTGDLLRSQIAQQTALGLEAKKLMDKGQLVPDEVVVGMISTALEENPQAKGFLFDGFPRTAAQAEALDGLLEIKKTVYIFTMTNEIELLIFFPV